jgi:hypothetical protein
VSGNYYNITVGTNTIKGSLSTANDYSRYNGQTVTVTGYYIGKTSTTYQNLVPTSISADPFFNLPTTSTNVTAIAGTVTFNVNANVDWTAAAASGNTMSISSVVADKAAGTVTVTYAENTASSAKTGVINVVTTDSNIATKTLTYTITQSAAVSGSRALASTDYVLGSNAYDVTVNGYSGFKFGTSSKTGSMTINPGFKSITLYAAGWSGDAATLSVTNGTPASTTLESDTVLTGSSPFTGVTKITTITITVTDPTSSVALSSVKAAKGRVVIWNIQVVPKS